MFPTRWSRRSDVRFVFAPALLAALLAYRPADAGIVLSVVNPQHNGIMGWDGPPQGFTPASENPAHLDVGNAHASMHQFGSSMTLSFEVLGKAFASTGIDRPNVFYDALPVLIEGTSGEAAGTPVKVLLDAKGHVPPTGYTDLFFNRTLYAVDQTYTFNLTIGDQFTLWAGLQGTGSDDYIMVVNLAVQSGGAGTPSSVPEPASLLLLATGLVPMLVWRPWRQRGRQGQFGVWR